MKYDWDSRTLNRGTLETPEDFQNAENIFRGFIRFIEDEGWEIFQFHFMEESVEIISRKPRIIESKKSKKNRALLGEQVAGWPPKKSYKDGRKAEKVDVNSGGGPDEINGLYYCEKCKAHNDELTPNHKCPACGTPIKKDS